MENQENAVKSDGAVEIQKLPTEPPKINFDFNGEIVLSLTQDAMIYKGEEVADAGAALTAFLTTNQLLQASALHQQVNSLVAVCHNASVNAGWWSDLETGARLPMTQERAGDKLMLIVTKIAEAKEGFRKNLADTHLPHRSMAEVELADAVIRIADLAGACGFDLGGAVAEKLLYNASRPDHRVENRKAEGGKKT